MKNQARRILTTLTLLLMIPVLALGAMAWRGSQPVTNIKTNLTLISEKMETLKKDSGNKDQVIRDIQILLEQEKGLREQRERELQDKQKEIQNKQTEIDQKNGVIDQKNGEINTKEQELEQALRDVQEIERLTEEMAR